MGAAAGAEEDRALNGRRTNQQMALMRVTRHGLEPVSRYDAEIIDAYRLGSELEVSLYTPKSTRQVRLFWAILGAIQPNQDRFATTRDMADALLTECGFFREAVVSFDGTVSVFPRSIRDLDKREFSAFFDAAMTTIKELIIPGLDIEGLIRDLPKTRGYR
jgi:hypothetical protein